MILVFGATRLLGGELVACARREKLDGGTVARRTALPDQLEGLRVDGAEVVWSDMKYPASLDDSKR